MNRITAHTAQEFTVHGVVFRSYLRSETGAREIGAWQAEFPPLTSGVPHRMSVEEIFRVLTGRVVIEIDGEFAELTAGDAVAIPAGSLFRVSNPTGEPASAWVVTPLGMSFSLDGADGATRPPWAQ